MSAEFELIARYFTRPAKGAVLGVGDDAALMRLRRGMELAVSTDMLVSGTHFFRDADPRRLGHKALAVNLSDMAAMGAVPRWALLSLALPGIDREWLKAFSAGFLSLARKFDVDLVGGDTTRGPLNLSVTIMGEVPMGQALRRDAARAGDDIWVSGVLGDAALAVAFRRRRVKLTSAEYSRCVRVLESPSPRVGLGIALRGIAHAAIDISDGVAADLGHICERSKLGAELSLAALPRSSIGKRLEETDIGRETVLAGGDDYELCFTASPAARTHIIAIGRRLGITLTRVGVMQRGRGVHLIGVHGAVIDQTRRGYDHFA